MTNTMTNQITNFNKNKYTRSLFVIEGGSRSSFSNSSNIDVSLSSSLKSNNSYGANPVIAIDIISPDSQELIHSEIAHPAIAGFIVSITMVYS